MYKKIQNAVVTGVATAMVAIGAIAVAPDSAEAACAGSNARNQITVDTAEVRMDSCVANDLVNGYGDAKDASALQLWLEQNTQPSVFWQHPFMLGPGQIRAQLEIAQQTIPGSYSRRLTEL